MSIKTHLVSQCSLSTEVEEVLSLETRVRDILRVEGVAVPGLVQTVDALLPPGPVQLAGQIIQGTIRTGTNIMLYYC